MFKLGLTVVPLVHSTTMVSSGPTSSNNKLNKMMTNMGDYQGVSQDTESHHPRIETGARSRWGAEADL